jgi:predicted AAA+ superfamily ATPase
LENYITAFLERDIPALGISLPSHTMRDFWIMLSHYHAQELNFSEFARSFGVSDMTVRRYLDILHDTFMVRILRPWAHNTKKRLVKRPKIYLRDSGVFHSLQHIFSPDTLLRNPRRGASWEGFAFEIAVRSIGRRSDDFYFWRVHAGAEVDLFWSEGGKNWAIEFKHCDYPSLTSSMQTALEELHLEHLWVVYPGDRRGILAKQISTLPVSLIGNRWDYSLK